MGNIRGVRNSTEISSDAQELYNILYIVDGTERLIFNGQEVDLNSGSIIIWDSTRPMKFITGNKLHQVTLSISHDRMRRFFPTIDDCIAIHFDTKKGASRLFANHLLTLDAEFGNLYHQQAKIVFDSTLQLLFSVLEGERFCNNCPTAITNLSAICAYINENLDDLNLSISSLASHFEISVRHLHRLFHNEETTLAGYILRKRLDRCSQELSSSVYRSQRITEIAYKWGFNDSSTFSKIFKREIGLTPREYRKKTLYNIR
jgi:AraC-like DNA-binding protein